MFLKSIFFIIHGSKSPKTELKNLSFYTSRNVVTIATIGYSARFSYFFYLGLPSYQI